MGKKKPPVELTREYFVEQGKLGGAIGGRASWAGLTKEERSARAKNAVAKRKWHPVKPPVPTKKRASRKPTPV